IGRFSPVRDGSVVAEAAAAGGFWTVRVGKRSGAQTALAANRAAGLRGIALRRICSRRAVAAIGLGVRRPHSSDQGQMPTPAIALRARFISAALCTRQRTYQPNVRANSARGQRFAGWWWAGTDKRTSLQP